MAILLLGCRQDAASPPQTSPTDAQLREARECPHDLGVDKVRAAVARAYDAAFEAAVPRVYRGQAFFDRIGTISKKAMVDEIGANVSQETWWAIVFPCHDAAEAGWAWGQVVQQPDHVDEILEAHKMSSMIGREFRRDDLRRFREEIIDAAVAKIMPKIKQNMRDAQDARSMRGRGLTIAEIAEALKREPPFIWLALAGQK